MPCNIFLGLADVDVLEERHSSANMSKFVPDKLTRSQRKRVRRRKLKEAASRRRKIIGPLLPSTLEDNEDTKGEPSNTEKEQPHVNNNETAQALEDSHIDKPGEF